MFSNCFYFLPCLSLVDLDTKLLTVRLPLLFEIKLNSHNKLKIVLLFLIVWFKRVRFFGKIQRIEFLYSQTSNKRSSIKRPTFIWR